MTITEFLLARIAEDEAAAREAIGRTRLNEFGELINFDMWHEQDWAEIGSTQRIHVETWHPTRVLAECEAKRRIMEEHPIYRGPRLVDVGIPGADRACETCHATSRLDDGSVIEALGPCDTLLALASVYADHPDFDPEWRAE